MNRNLPIVIIAMILVVGGGCEEDDERLAQYAEESVRQQAGQNREMAQLNREVAQTHRDIVNLQQGVEQRQVQVDQQRDQLERERRQIAERRHRDPVIAAAIYNVGMVLACMIPLALAGYLLFMLQKGNDDASVSELLIEDLTCKEPLLLPSPEPEAGGKRLSTMNHDRPQQRLPPTNNR